MNTKKTLWLVSLVSLLLVMPFINSCKDENVEIIVDCPLVISTIPENLDVNVPLDQIITATFNVEMNPTTFTQASFTVVGASEKSAEETGKTKAVNAITGTVSFSGKTATFIPSSPLAEGTTYTCTIMESVTDMMGTALQTDHVWTFTTGVIIIPMVTSTDPVDLAIGVSADKIVTANFSIEMDPLTITDSSFTLMDGLTPVEGSVSYTGTTATFIASSPFALGKTYTATITAAAANLEGTPLAEDYVWTFSTPGIAPTVISTVPLNLATNVDLDQVISANFSIEMDPLTITETSFTLYDGATQIEGTVEYSGTTATFTPDSDLELDITYTATITNVAANLAGTTLFEDYVWTFSTSGISPTITSTVPANLAINVNLDQTVSANFSMEMDPLTITETSFTLFDGATQIEGTVDFAGTIATLNPDNNLEAGKTYTATITNVAANLEGITLAEDYVWTFSTSGISPTVTSTIPANLAINVNLGQLISANFSMEMDPLTITETSFTLYDGATQIEGTVDYAGTIATFNPDNNLEAGKTYTATITNVAANLAGTTLEQDYVWTFSTLGIAPTVTSTVPANLAMNVSLDQTVSANFSMEMDPLTITETSFTLYDGAIQIEGTVDYAGTIATLNPDNNLEAGKTYTATITNAAASLAGTTLASNYVWTFSTTVLSPTVTSTLPVNLAMNVNLDQTVSANFSMEMDPLTITETSFTLYDGAIQIDGSVGYSGNTATFDPDSDLESNTTYTATITTVAANLAGTTLVNDYVWSFTTELITPPLGPGVVDLGSSGDFAILTKTGISTTGNTMITGHIGVSPIGHTAITGFSETMDASGTFSTSIYVEGRIFASDYLDPTPAYVSTAMSDQETAFTTGMGMTTNVIIDLGAGDISGMTLPPALYKWGTGLLITNEGVTLAGGPNDTWVFQISDDFTIQDNAIITLTGGAQASNIFWITSTQALLGSNVIFQGNILAQTLISLTDGTTVIGRLLSQTGVTLDASTVTKP